MPSLSGKFTLVVGVKQSRRLGVSDRVRKAGAVVVEAMTVQQAEAAMRQIRFEFVFVDFLGAGLGMLGFLENLRAEDPESHVFVVGPPVDWHVFGKLQSPDLVNLGFGDAPDSIGEVLSTVLAEADDRKNVGTSGTATATSRFAKPSGRQE